MICMICIDVASVRINHLVKTIRMVVLLLKSQLCVSTNKIVNHTTIHCVLGWLLCVLLLLMSLLMSLLPIP
jgi:hypothetical protein